MRPRLLFAHGWALDYTLWDRVRALLGADALDAVVLDAGYYGAPHEPDKLDAERPVLGVGQSLGALNLLAAPPVPLAGLVAIDGFARFSEAADFPQGNSGRVLDLLAKRMRKSAGPVVADFLAKALGASSPPREGFDIHRLAEGLQKLAELDGRAASRRLPIWRLHASNDPIASLAMADASFAGAQVMVRQVREAGDHLSPVTAAETCAELIRTALRALTR
jgi:pimeloyl-[acyl-carrier protein] methyl ester esterase